MADSFSFLLAVGALFMAAHQPRTPAGLIACELRSFCVILADSIEDAITYMAFIESGGVVIAGTAGGKCN